MSTEFILSANPDNTYEPIKDLGEGNAEGNFYTAPDGIRGYYVQLAHADQYTTGTELARLADHLERLAAQLRIRAAQLH